MADDIRQPAGVHVCKAEHNRMNFEFRHVSATLIWNDRNWNPRLGRDLVTFCLSLSRLNFRNCPYMTWQTVFQLTVRRRSERGGICLAFSSLFFCFSSSKNLVWTLCSCHITIHTRIITLFSKKLTSTQSYFLLYLQQSPFTSTSVKLQQSKSTSAFQKSPQVSCNYLLACVHLNKLNTKIKVSPLVWTRALYI